MLRKSTLIYAQFSDLQYNTVQSRSFLYYFTPTFAILNMVIAINTKALLPDKMEGYGYYIEEIFSRVAINHPEHQFYFLFDRAFDEEFIYAAN
ncbi:MAG: hypothetical protein KA160_00165, partial [Lacibacter sp.]|nr:hypothetical protein [Lacibacter sp.]